MNSKPPVVGWYTSTAATVDHQPAVAALAAVGPIGAPRAPTRRANHPLGSYSPSLLLHVVNRLGRLLFAVRHPIDEQRVCYRQHHRPDEEPGDAERDEPTNHAREDQ